MKKILFLTGVMIAFSAGSFAGSRLVMENGGCTSCSPPVYGTISAAVAAASAGDTIFIKARAGNAPYEENVMITQSLDFVPYYNDSLWYCEGTWTINPSFAGSTVDIVGMVNLSGAVTGTSAPSGTRTTVRLLGGGMGFLNSTVSPPVTGSGYICFNVPNYDVTVYGMKINNDYQASGNNAITIKHGTIVGDSIVQQNGGTTGNTSYGAIYVSSESAVTTDTAFIIGNIISVIDLTGTYSTGTYALYGIVWNSWTMGFDIRNNLVLTQDDGINIDTVRNGLLPVNKLYNNTVNFIAPSGSAAGATHYTIALDLNPYDYSGTGAVGSNSVVEAVNDLVAHNTLNTTATNYNYGIDCNSTSTFNGGNYNAGNGMINMSYNYVDSRFSPILNGAPTLNNAYTNSLNLVLGTLTTISSISPPTAGPVASVPPVSTGVASTTSLGYQTSATMGVNLGNPALSNGNLFGPGSGIYAPYSQNTVGAYGGPFDIQNYFAVAPNASNYTGPAVLYMNSGSARAFSTPSSPTITTVGSTGFYMKATSFDR